MRKLFTVGLLALSCSSATAEVAQKDAAYFCVAEIAGGLAFDANLKKWISGTFKPTEKFVLRLKFIDVKPGTGRYDKDDIYTNFAVTLTRSGTKLNQNCHQSNSGRSEYVSVSKYGSFSCDAGLEEYHFNLDTNRYMSFYYAGYTDGADNNDNTPAVTGGTCTKID
jgi:hypothetical protein